MAKKSTPVITHTEILARAIQSINTEINGWRDKCSGLLDTAALFDSATNELTNKLDALKTMYYFETGTNYEQP